MTHLKQTTFENKLTQGEIAKTRNSLFVTMFSTLSNNSNSIYMYTGFPYLYSGVYKVVAGFVKSWKGLKDKLTMITSNVRHDID